MLHMIQMPRGDVWPITPGVKRAHVCDEHESHHCRSSRGLPSSGRFSLENTGAFMPRSAEPAVRTQALRLILGMQRDSSCGLHVLVAHIAIGQLTAPRALRMNLSGCKQLDCTTWPDNSEDVSTTVVLDPRGRQCDRHMSPLPPHTHLHTINARCHAN